MEKNNYFSNCFTRCDVTEIKSALTNSTDADINRRDPAHGLQTIIMRLCHLGITPGERLDILDLVLSKNPDVNTRDADERTVLHHACIGQCSEVFQTLACCTNCEPNGIDNDGNTPLILAVLSNNTSVVEGFLESFAHLGLDVHHKNNQGLTAYDEASRKDYKEICNILTSMYNVKPSPIATISKQSSPLATMSKQPVQQNSKMATGRITRRELRKKQAEKLAPVIGSNHAAMLPVRNEQINHHSSIKPLDRQDANNVPQTREAFTVDTHDVTERYYFDEFRESRESSDAGYTDDDFCADDEDDDDVSQIYDQTVTDFNFALGMSDSCIERRGSFSLPDLRGGNSSLVSSSNPSSTSVRSEGAQVGVMKTLQDKYANYNKEDLALPQLAEFTQDSSADETSDDSYTEPLTPRSKAAQRESSSLPEISHRSFVPNLALKNLITPRGVELVFTTDSEGSAPNTFRGIDISKNMSDSLPQISSRTRVKNSARGPQPKNSRTSLTCNNQGLGSNRVLKENPDSWLYNKSQKKVELRLVSTQYNR